MNAIWPDSLPPTMSSQSWDDMESVELLLSAGAAVNARNDYGVTPLSLAAENANLMAVQRLIKAGADVNVATSTGETPLMTAVPTASMSPTLRSLGSVTARCVLVAPVAVMLSALLCRLHTRP